MCEVTQEVISVRKQLNIRPFFLFHSHFPSYTFVIHFFNEGSFSINYVFMFFFLYPELSKFSALNSLYLIKCVIFFVYEFV